MQSKKRMKKNNFIHENMLKSLAERNIRTYQAVIYAKGLALQQQKLRDAKMLQCSILRDRVAQLKELLSDKNSTNGTEQIISDLEQLEFYMD